MSWRENHHYNDEYKAQNNTEISVVCPRAHTTTTCKNIRWAWQQKVFLKTKKNNNNNIGINKNNKNKTQTLE